MSESAQFSGGHPDRGLLERFMRNDASGSEKRRIVRHLLAGCPRCVAVTRDIWELAGGRPTLASLLGPLGSLDSDTEELTSLPDLRPGNLLRTSPKTSETTRSIRSAVPLLEPATPWERLEVLRLDAALAADRGRFEEADGLLDHAVEACHAAGELRLAGVVLIERGTLHATSGRYESAIELLGEGTDLLGKESPVDPAFLAAAFHRRADLLFEVGRGEEARAVAGQLLSLYKRLGDAAKEEVDATGEPVELDEVDTVGAAGLLRLRWLLGKIEEDETALLQVREDLLTVGLGLAAAQVSLDLAVVYARKGCWGEIRHLAAEIFPILRTRDLRRESMAGLLVFRRAVETESATLEFLVEVARYLLGSRRTRWGA